MSNNADAIRAAREEAGYSRADLAGATGLSAKQLRYIEHGRDIRAHEIGAICRILPLDPLVLLGMGGACSEAGGWCEVDNNVALGGVCGGAE